MRGRSPQPANGGQSHELDEPICYSRLVAGKRAARDGNRGDRRMKTIAATILAAPDPFYAGYGIDVSSDVSLANELKAPAGTLLVAGLLMLVGVVKPRYAVTSLAIGSVSTFLTGYRAC